MTMPLHLLVLDFLGDFVCQNAGMVTLAGFSGEFAPHLFVVADA